jgi:hypothetical protein
MRAAFAVSARVTQWPPPAPWPPLLPVEAPFYSTPSQWIIPGAEIVGLRITARPSARPFQSDNAGQYDTMFRFMVQNEQILTTVIDPDALRRRDSFRFKPCTKAWPGTISAEPEADRQPRKSGAGRR